MVAFGTSQCVQWPALPQQAMKLMKRRSGGDDENLAIAADG
jgi:hypothetical protein